VIRSLRRALFWALVIAVGVGLADAFGLFGDSIALAAGGVGVAIALLNGGLSALGAVRRPPVGSSGGWSAEASGFDQAVARPPAPTVVPEVVQQAERLAVLAQATAGDVHFRLRPVLRDIAAELLADLMAVELDGDERAEAVLGPDLWEVVRPGRPAPDVRQAPGITAEQLESFLARLEAIG